jgi:hypothetical protein
VSKCNRCGQIIAEGALSCQSCGAPVILGGSGVQQLRVAQLVDEEALPTWLRSMSIESEADAAGRSSLPPLGSQAAASSSPPSMPASSSGERLPEWLRMMESARSSAPQSLAQSSLTPVASDSLIEEDALPEWLRASASLASAVSQALSNSLPGIMETTAEKSAAGQTAGVNADTLIDAAAIPDWVRQSMAAPSSQANPILGSIPISPLPPAAPLPPTHKGAPANLSDTEDEHLPAWLRRVYEDAHVPPWTGPGVSDKPEEGAPSAAPGSTEALTLKSLVDPASLPDWLQKEAATSASAAPVASTPSTGSSAVKERLSAASLIEMSSLPEWLRAEQTEPPQATSAPAATAASASMPAPLAASDLIDGQSLPSWLRSGEAAVQPADEVSAAPPGAPPSSPAESLPDWFQQLSSSPVLSSRPVGNATATGSASDQPVVMPPMNTSVPSVPPMAQPPTAEPGSNPQTAASWQQSTVQPAAEPSKSQQGISVASLFDADALPDWLRGPADAPSAEQPPRVDVAQQVDVDTAQLRAASIFAAVAGPTPVASPMESWSSSSKGPSSAMQQVSGAPAGPNQASDASLGSLQQPSNASYGTLHQSPGVPGQMARGQQHVPAWPFHQEPGRPYLQGPPPVGSGWRAPGGYPHPGTQPIGNAPYANTFGGVSAPASQRGVASAAPGNVGVAPSRVPTVVARRGFWAWLRSLFRFLK